MAAWLVEQGIDSVSLSPDALMATTRRILEAERAREPRPSRATSTGPRDGGIPCS
jgi:hypothetical protein